MKILIADKFPETSIQILNDLGCEVHYNSELTEASLPEAVKNTEANILVVRSTAVKADALTAGKLSLVIRSGAGYNTIDVATASANGIYVSNCPGKNSIAVAELAFGLMLAIDRRIPDNVSQFRNGTWNKKEFSKAKGLFGKRLGLIGIGRIGQEMILRAKAFGMPVVAWSRSLTQEQAVELGIEYRDSPAEVAQNCDVLSIHVALNSDTRSMIDSSVLNLLPKGSTFINTSRAEVIDEEALLTAITERNLKVGLDVFREEPTGGTGTINSKLCAMEQVYVTHHIGASTDQAQDATSSETIRIILSYKENGSVPNVVNLAKHSPARHLLVVRHYDRVGVLADVFTVLKQAGINVQETENIVFEGASAAIARIHVDQSPSNEVLNHIRSGNNIIELALLHL